MDGGLKTYHPTRDAFSKGLTSGTEWTERDGMRLGDDGQEWGRGSSSKEGIQISKSISHSFSFTIFMMIIIIYFSFSVNTRQTSIMFHLVC